MALSELIKYEGDNSTFIWKYPHEDFNNMTELIVHESQEAIFFANGQAADTFGPGRYKLDADNIPILTKLVNIVTGISVFHCEVYFINKTVQMAVKWGTDSKVRFNEPTLGVPIELGASGSMNLSIADGKKLLVNLVGTMKGIAWENEGAGFTKSLQLSFRPLITTAVKSNLSSAIKQKNIDIVEIDEHLTELSEVLKTEIAPGFDEYGLSIQQFYVTNIVLPEDDPNFRRLRELHTITLQKQMAAAEAEVRASQAQNRASYMAAEAEAEAKIKAAQRGAILEGQTTETEIAKREAERKLIQAQADAQAAQISGMAEATVMQAKGYNQKDVLQAEVQKAYAEGIGNMGSGVSSGSGSPMGDMLGLGMSMAAMNAMAPQVGAIMKNFNIGNTDNTSASNSESLQNQNTKCPNCGSLLPSNAKFCLECGTKIETLSDNEIICPNCGKKTPKGKFCIECGQPLINKCPNCGAEVPPNGKFCLECGTKLI
ncbi:SPFH domain-containing protein [Anaerotignum sp. MSJ-24]|uniref:SPFH domain-containing protein n=1 Tax=Anaerotignum sp. MSJ-24 TaxID=2841521 RepID=UPI001C125738|nr:SPFH domain-containing protein [Anaerotignum sp. MSJ-24]MBU5463435.1 SPFH domain-containing protein [Anaerotignum sp. MSJ-24]